MPLDDDVYDPLYSILTGDKSLHDWPKKGDKGFRQRVYRKLKSDIYAVKEIHDPTVGQPKKGIVEKYEVPSPPKFSPLHFCKWCLHVCKCCLHFCKWCLYFCEWCLYFFKWCLHFCKWCLYFFKWWLHFSKWCLYFF